MKHLLAIICPPLAVLLCGKGLQFLLNIVLTCAFYIPGVVHAILVVNSHLADERTRKIVRSIEKKERKNEVITPSNISQSAEIKGKKGGLENFSIAFLVLFVCVILFGLFAPTKNKDESRTNDLLSSDTKSRSREILALLKKIPEKEYEKNKNLYQKLVILNPDNHKYKSKLSYYSKKIKGQKEKQSNILKSQPAMAAVKNLEKKDNKEIGVHSGGYKGARWGDSKSEVAKALNISFRGFSQHGLPDYFLHTLNIPIVNRSVADLFMEIFEPGVFLSSDFRISFSVNNVTYIFYKDKFFAVRLIFPLDELSNLSKSLTQKYGRGPRRSSFSTTISPMTHQVEVVTWDNDDTKIYLVVAQQSSPGFTLTTVDVSYASRHLHELIKKEIISNKKVRKENEKEKQRKRREQNQKRLQ